MEAYAFANIRKKGDTFSIMDGDSRSLLIIFIILVFLGAYFASTESAVSLMNKIRIKNMADEGNKKAKKALYVSNNFDKAITTLLIGNNIVHIAAASVATLLVMNLLSESSLDDGAKGTIATVATTFIVFLFSEMLPKSFANDRPLGTALSLSGILKFLMKICAPLNVFFGKISSAASNMFKSEEEPSITEEELYEIIDTAEEEGVVDEEQSDLFKSAMEFSDTTVKDVMTMREDICALDVSMKNSDIMQAIRRSNYSRLPVYEGSIDNIIGTLPIRSFIREYYKNNNLDVRTLLVPPFFVRTDAKIDDALSVMRQHKFYLATVSGDNGETLGLVTIEDFLEELVGEIWDEDEAIDNNFQKLGGSKYRVSTRMTVSETFQRIRISEPPEHIAKRPILSWIIEEFGRIPEEDESFHYENIDVEVDTVENGKVTFVQIKVTDEPEPTETDGSREDDIKIVGGEDIL